MTDMDKLIAAVEAGVDTAHHHAAAFPSESAHGHCTWHDSHKASTQGSLDAALRLHEALLPGWEWHLGPSNAKIYPFNRSPLKSWSGMADNPARAWLLAILRALKAKDAADGEVG